MYHTEGMERALQSFLFSNVAPYGTTSKFLHSPWVLLLKPLQLSLEYVTQLSSENYLF